MTTLTSILQNALAIAKTIDEPVQPVQPVLESCPYCLEEINEKENKAVLCCGHQCHLLCLLQDKYINKNSVLKCSLCRARVISMEKKREWLNEQDQARRFQEQQEQELLEQLRREHAEEMAENERRYQEQQARDERARQEINENLQERDERRREIEESRRFTHYNLNTRIRSMPAPNYQLRRGSCAMDIIQILASAEGYIHFDVIYNVFNHGRGGYSRPTIRRAFSLLRRNGYINFMTDSNSRHVNRIRLSDEFRARIN